MPVPAPCRSTPDPIAGTGADAGGTADACAGTPFAVLPLPENGSDLEDGTAVPLFCISSPIVGGGAVFFCSGSGSSPGKIHLFQQARERGVIL